MIKEKIPSKYQVDIKDAYINTNKNIIVAAGPGSGKSHTILELLKVTPPFKKTILTAFNKSIKEEIQSKVAPNIKVSTIHSLAYSILRKNFCANFKVNTYKNYILGKKCLNLSRLKEKERDVYLFTISKIIDLVRLNLAKTNEEIENICNQYNISIINGELADTVTLIEELAEYNSRDHKDFMIDFTDMLYLTYIKVAPEDYPKYSIVFVDELQDLNSLQKTIIENIIAPNGRFIGVGDFHQSIYSFMGANVDAFHSFQNRPNTITLPLSVTYRCGKKIVEEANKIFDGLESFEENCEGVVRRGNIEEVEDGDFVICRNNLPLIEAWISIIKQGKRCHIMGKDFGQNLITIITKLSKYPDYIEGVNDILKKKEEQLKEKGISKPKNNVTYQALVEKLNIIEILRKEFGSFERMERKVNEIFNDEDRSGVTLCTGHKSKGLEADRVFFLQRNLIPSKYAETPTELYQERCLSYVITTRAKRELIYVD